jgi:Protein of unknown function (DUF3179)
LLWCGGNVILVFQMMHQNINPTRTGSGNRGLGLLLGLLAAFSLSLFMIPAFVIQPFRHQTDWALRLAIAVKHVAPTLTLITLVGVLALSWSLWRRSSASSSSTSKSTSTRWSSLSNLKSKLPHLKSKLPRAGIVFAVTLSLVSAVMVRQNYFEWMFNPIKAAGFIPASEAKLSDKEMVMTVQVGSEQRAYPIVQMAYHHILNDTVGGVPIVVTY